MPRLLPNEQALLYQKQTKSDTRDLGKWAIPLGLIFSGVSAIGGLIIKLVEARRNRLNKVARPYREHRQPYHKNNDQNNGNRKPNLRQAVQPVQEIDTAPIIDMFRCTYKDIEEAIDLYNLDVEECQSA